MLLLLLGNQENKISFCVDYLDDPPLYQLKTFFTGIEAIYNKITRDYKKKLIDKDRLKVQQISLKSPFIINLLGDPQVTELLFFILALLFNKLEHIKDKRYFDKEFLGVKDLLTENQKRLYKNVIIQSIRKKSAQKITIKFGDREIAITKEDSK
jgi:hypothetical protein